MLIFEQIKSDRMANFSYILGDEASKEVAIVDPSFNAEKLIDLAGSRGLEVRYVVNTHSHRDHTYSNDVIGSRFSAMIVAHKTATVRKDVSVVDGDILNVGDIQIRVIHTPGHSPDGICLLANKKLLTGDTLFVGECGHTRHGSAVDMYHSLFDKLVNLDDDIEVFPGHDYGPRPSSTIGLEKRTNYVLEERTLEEFIKFMRE